MATASNTSNTDEQPPNDNHLDKAKDGRPIFTTSHYNKKPLTRRGEIRILKVHPGAPEQKEVQCELIISRIFSEKDGSTHKTSDMNSSQENSDGEFMPYDALSWCWGKAPSNSWISILQDETSYVKYVQPGLVAALQALRHGTYARYLWVDAVCINQDYKAEKNHQVEMMADIYGQADCVRIWLGGSDSSSDLAILFIKQEILQLQHFDDLSSSKDTSGKWRALLELMQRDWFSRRWVIQEVALAKKAIIHCGKAKLAWTKFAMAVELFVEVETATHRLSEVMKTDAKYHHVPRWFEYISQLGASLLVDATGKLFRDYDYIPNESTQVKKLAKKSKTSREPEDELCYESEDDEVISPQERVNNYKKNKNGQRSDMKRQPLLTLEYLVSNMSIFDVTNPHDSIYALLGIAKDTTPTAADRELRMTDHSLAAFEMYTVKKQYPVNYQASYIDICKEFIQFCVHRNVSRDPSRALDVICRPWAIEIERTNNEPVLPSWLPRLSKASYGMVLSPGIDAMRMGRKNADSLVGLPNVTHRNYNAAETKGLDKKTFKFRKRENSEGSLDHFSLYVQGFILDEICSVKTYSQNGLIPTEWAHFAHWGQMEGTPPERFWRTLVADRGSDGKNPPVYFSRACQESFRKGGTAQGGVDTTGLIEHERNSVVAQFCRRVQAAIWNRALIKTKDDRLGLVANNVEDGDLVCILYGCSVPVVLRRFGPKELDVMDREIDLELKYMANYISQSYKTHAARQKIFREKREKDKAKYKIWEDEKRKEFKKDEKWRDHWQLVREGLVQIHEFRAWVMNWLVILLKNAGKSEDAEKAKCTMHNFVHILLSEIHEIATWAVGVSDNEGTIIDRLQRSTINGSAPDSFKLTSDETKLWDEFKSEEGWSTKWEGEKQHYVENEGSRAWSCKNHKIGYAKNEQRTWEGRKVSAKEWSQEWAKENPWFLCIDPFRAWLRENGRLCGTEEYVNNIQKREGDIEWHSKSDKENASFETLNHTRGRGNSKPDISLAEEESNEYGKWRLEWRTNNPEADMKTERNEWDKEWQKRKSDSQKSSIEETKIRKERAEKRDKEPFIERWREGWSPPTVNWKEFEIALSYGRRWLKFVRQYKQDYAKNQEKLWATSHEVELRQQKRASHSHRLYRYPSPAANTTEVIGSNPQEVGENQEAEASRLPVGERTMASAAFSHLSDGPVVYDQQDEEKVELYKYHQELINFKPCDRWSWDDFKSRIDVKKARWPHHWGKSMKSVDNKYKEWRQSTHKFIDKDTKRRVILTPNEQDKYYTKIKENFRSQLGDDGNFYYEMLGECYIHGMMDGEAMAYQNDKGIPRRVFEIR